MARKKKPEKNKVGRPTKYRPEFCELLIRHAADGGLQYDSFPGYLYEQTGMVVNLDTLYEWEKVHPEFSEAKKAAYGMRRINWERLGSEAMKGKAPGFNTTAWIFIGKNCHGWKDKHEITGGGPDGEIEVNLNRTKIKSVLEDPELAAAAIKIARLLASNEEK